MTQINLEQREFSLRKKITTLQWDLPMMTNQELKKSKETELKLLQSELQGLRPN